MIEAGLEFHEGIDDVLTAFSALPPSLKPIYFSHEEKIVDTADQFQDESRFAAFRARSESGFYLLGESVTYSFRLAKQKPLICDCFVDVPHAVAKQFLVMMSAAQPLFGFACLPAEREHRNLIRVKQGQNTIENWVGRDTQKSVPGLYWLTLLSEDLAKLHGVPLDAIEAVALEHATLGRGQHLFCFYERPEDWQKTNAVTALCASLPGVFNIEQVRPHLLTAKTFLELSSLLRTWR